jgi:hypothetical protein
LFIVGVDGLWEGNICEIFKDMIENIIKNFGDSFGALKTQVHTNWKDYGSENIHVMFTYNHGMSITKFIILNNHMM